MKLTYIKNLQDDLQVLSALGKQFDRRKDKDTIIYLKYEEKKNAFILSQKKTKSSAKITQLNLNL
ncbi:MAG: hypothetical protein [Arizlama microvirus]|nr:MAG: hypothetical protein [Arizlama microvirus]